MHFVYAGDYYHWHENTLRQFIFNGMKKYKINSVMVTSIRLDRRRLITKEKMESYCNGEDSERKDSVNDDLESLFENIRLDKELDEGVPTYFLPKLTGKELELVERRDTSYLQTFSWVDFADVHEAEMKLSESDSKYVKVEAYRRTYEEHRGSIEDLYQMLSETSSENSSEKQSCLKNFCNCSLQ